MLYKNEEDFAKALRQGVTEGLFLLYGSESYLVESYVKKLVKPFSGGLASFNLQRLDGRRLDCDLLFDAVETMPLMSQEKCVVVDDLDLKPLSPEQLEQLRETVSDLPPGVTLILTGRAAFDTKTAAVKQLIKLCADKGSAVSLGLRGPGALATFLKGRAHKNGCQLSTDLARYMVQTCESDMGVLAGEVDKVCAFAGGAGDITRQHIDAVVNPRTEVRVFDLGKAILSGNAQRALELLGDLFYLREQPLAILATLTMAYVDLYRARVAKDSGKSPADVVALFGYKGREFRITNAWNSRLSPAVLRASLGALLACDRRIKSTGVDDKILLEQTVVELLALGAGV